MSIQTELTRLTNAKAAIQTAIEGKGVTVPSGTLLDGMAALIESIEACGGGGNIVSGNISWATVTTNMAQTEFVHNLGVAPKLFLICPAFDITSSTTKNIGVHLISTVSLGSISRYYNGNIRIYYNTSDYAMKSMQDFSNSKSGVYADSTKLILVTFLDSVFTVEPGDIYNWIAVG